MADNDFKAFEKKNKIYICVRHYSIDSIGLTNTGKKTVKSHDIAKIGRKPPRGWGGGTHLVTDTMAVSTLWH